MITPGSDEAIARFALGFAALLIGALGVQYSKWLEVGTQPHPREQPNPYFELVRFLAGLVFLCGLVLIAWSAWSLLA